MNRNTKNQSQKAKINKERTDWFTIKENQLLETLKRFKRLSDAASELGLSYRRAERILANIRRKWELSVNTHNRLVGLCRRDQAMRKLLSKPAPRIPREEPITKKTEWTNVEEDESEWRE
jgi:FixJ family two-component response regulator